MVNRTLYICPRCGRSIFGEQECTFCGCTMIKTQYTENDYYETENKELFKNRLLNQYVYGNPLYSDTEYQHRIEFEYERIHGSSSALRCPNCGSTAITTGQRGYSVIYGFAGSSRTVNRCGNCGYKWEP